MQAAAELGIIPMGKVLACIWLDELMLRATIDCQPSGPFASRLAIDQLDESNDDDGKGMLMHMLIGALL